MGRNLDDHYGSPDMVRVLGSVTVPMVAEVPEHASDDERRRALRETAVKDLDVDQVLNAEIGEIEPLP